LTKEADGDLFIDSSMYMYHLQHISDAPVSSDSGI